MESKKDEFSLSGIEPEAHAPKTLTDGMEQGKVRKKELLKLLSEKEQKQAKKLNKDIKKGKKIKEFSFRFRKGKEDSICLTIPKKIVSEYRIAYRWDNAEGDFSEYEYFKIYDNKFKSISANRDINKGAWSKKYNKHINYTEEEFLAELKVMYCILIELNLKRFETPDESRMKVNLFFRKVIINIQKNSKYVFSRKYVFAQLGKWRFNYLKNPNQTLLQLKRILGNRGKIIRERDFMLREGAVIEQVEGEHNSFLSRLSEDRKRHSIKKLFSSGLISDLRVGYLRPIMTEDLNLCKYSHREIKKAINRYNEELTGGTYNNHLDNYVEVAEYVADCFDVYEFIMRSEGKMCKFSNTLYIDTNIRCYNIYTQFTESKYFPKVSDVERELNVGNRRSITKSLQALKRPIKKYVKYAEPILMLIHFEAYELKNIKTNGKSRLAIVPIENFSRDKLIKIWKAKKAKEDFDKEKFDSKSYKQSNLTIIRKYVEDRNTGKMVYRKCVEIDKSVFDDYEVDYNASLELYRDNDFDVFGWRASEVMPRQFEKEYSDDLLDLVRDIEQSCSSVIELDSKQVKLYM